jgi:hypothetical protein
MVPNRYKVHWVGGSVKTASRWFPSSRFGENLFAANKKTSNVYRGLAVSHG